jgi:membrane protease YdiL (CAAX protease family)
VKNGRIATGIVSGVIILLSIVGGFFIFGDKLIDKDFFITKLASVGLTNPWLYFGAMMYWILINSVLEEYVWRWFCLEKCAMLTSKWGAVFLSAAFFTLHHILAMSVYFSPITVLVCSLGVFIGGLIWSAMYLRYQSIYPGYISHVFADIAIFGCGAWILFG